MDQSYLTAVPKGFVSEFKNWDTPF
jgi:hypothetical protein